MVMFLSLPAPPAEPRHRLNRLSEMFFVGLSMFKMRGGVYVSPNMVAVIRWPNGFSQKLDANVQGEPLPPPVAQVSAGVGKPSMDSECASGRTWSMARATVSGLPSPGQPTPGVVKQDKSSGGSVDITKTCLGPQRVRMSSGERPIGAARGKQSDTEALCQPPPPPVRPPYISANLHPPQVGKEASITSTRASRRPLGEALLMTQGGSK